MLATVALATTSEPPIEMIAELPVEALSWIPLVQTKSSLFALKLARVPAVVVTGSALKDWVGSAERPQSVTLMATSVLSTVTPLTTFKSFPASLTRTMFALASGSL